MKSNVIISLIVSAIINLVGMLINYLSFLDRNYLKLAIKNYGGECMLESGFGLRVFHSYPMMEGQTSSHNLSFDILGLIASVLIIGILVFVILLLVKKIIRK